VLHVDVGTVGDLAVVFPLIYVLLALPTGRWLDRRFALALGVGAALTAGGGVIRVLSPESFTVQLIGQLVIAAGQPLVLNSITKVAGRYFPKDERATAVSIGSVALFIGILLAVLTGGPLFDAGGLPLVLSVQAVFAVIAAALLLLVLRTPPAFIDDPSAAVSLGWLRRDRFMWILGALVFLGMGTYNAVATWLQPILAHYGEGSAAGVLIAAMTLAGVIGAAILPSAVAQRDQRRSLLIAALVLTALTFAALTLRDGVAWFGIWLFLDGLLLMASLPVVLDWSELHVGLERQGTAAGFLFMAGNLGGLVLVLLVQPLIGGVRLPFLALMIASLIGIPLATRLPARAEV